MKKIHTIIILVTMILSAGCILGVSYYDIKKETICELHEAIKGLPIDLKKIEIDCTGIKENEFLSISELYKKERILSEKLSHTEGCSKLCKTLHEKRVTVSLLEEKGTQIIEASGYEVDPTYKMVVKNQKDTTYNTYYRMHIEGLTQIGEIDNMRNLTYQLYHTLGVNLKESIAFTGEMKGRLDKETSLLYAQNLFKWIDAKFQEEYYDDLNESTYAFYGYTKKIDQYTLDRKGNRTNVQISFSYDEVEDITNVIIAFPFYNEVF